MVRHGRLSLHSLSIIHRKNGLGVSSVINDLEIYPNPSRDIFNIEVASDEVQEVEIIVVNSIGQEIFNERVEVEGQYIKQIDLSNYSKGIYNLSIKNLY